MKLIWEEFLAFELEHLRIAADLIKKHEKRDPEEIIGDKVVLPCHFESQKEYVADVLLNEADKRLDGTERKGYTTIDDSRTTGQAMKFKKLSVKKVLLPKQQFNL